MWNISMVQLSEPFAIYRYLLMSRCRQITRTASIGRRSLKNERNVKMKMERCMNGKSAVFPGTTCIVGLSFDGSSKAASLC